MKRPGVGIALSFLFGVLTAAWYLWPAAGPEEEPQVAFKLPDNATAFLAYRNELTGKTKMIPLNASAGDVVKFTVSDVGEAMPLNDIFSMALSRVQDDEKSGEAVPVNLGNSEAIEFVRIESASAKQSRLNFIWQNPANPLLIRLREREELDSLLKESSSEIERFTVLQNWTRSQWEPGTPNPYPKWNAIEILDSIRAGKTGGFCGQYTQVFVQALASLGYQARYVELRGHVTVEVWSNELGKWILMDPFYGLVFLRKGTRLNAHEVYRAVKSEDGPYDIEVRSTLTGGVLHRNSPQRRKILSHFETFGVYTKNDHIEDDLPSDRVLAETWKHTVVLADEHFSKREFTGGMIPLITQFESDLYFPLNSVAITPLELRGDVLALRLESNCPYPASPPFAVSINGGEFKPSPDSVNWRLAPGNNVLKVRAVNSSGIKGPESVIELVRLRG